MDALKVGAVVYKAGAISNWILTIPAFVAYDAYIGALMPAKPNFPFLIWIWSGMAVLWGVMFWELSGDLISRRRMIKYSYLEKGVTSVSVLAAVASGNLLPANALGIFFSDVIWIPAFVLIHLAVRRRAAAAAV